jgi:hypothetical protein
MPPARYRIVERGGRLEVIDGETGERPLSAAERMAAHDAAHGHAALRYDRVEAARAAAPPPVAPTPSDPIRARLGDKASPWQASGEAKPPRAKRLKDAPPTAISQLAKGTYVTGKWWDSKGPRTVTLGQKGREKLVNSIMATLIVAFFIFIALAVIQPALLLVAGFALFRFGGTIIGPIGARLIDQAIAADR